ncbi:MAG: hypothetical protein F2723_02015 [Actinobacteria bacterium]|nr:hypothetical protein [Actinomycetota bacterium]
MPPLPAAGEPGLDGPLRESRESPIDQSSRLADPLLDRDPPVARGALREVERGAPERGAPLRAPLALRSAAAALPAGERGSGSRSSGRPRPSPRLGAPVRLVALLRALEERESRESLESRDPLESLESERPDRSSP